MKAFLSLAALAVAAVAAPAHAEELVPIKSCTPGRVWIWNSTELEPATLVGQGREPGKCLVRVDEMLTWGEIDASITHITTMRIPATPDPRMIELGRLPSIDITREREMRALAELSHANARVFLSRFQLSHLDSLLVAKLCTGWGSEAVCRKASNQFQMAVTANNRAIEYRNADADAAARRARAAASATSGSYGGGTYGRDSSSSVYRPSSGTTSSTSVPSVQSESTIRQNQARCRAGSGPC